MVTITGAQPGDFLRLVPLREISHLSYEVTASLAGCHVVNGSISVEGVPEFTAALRAFADTRSGKAVLSGTYDFRLDISPHGRSGAAWVGFFVAEYVWLDNCTHGRHVLEGGLVVHGEYVGQMAKDLTTLLTCDDSWQQVIAQ